MSAHLAIITLAPGGDYVAGQQVNVSMAFTVDGVATDPTGVTLLAQRPAGSVLTLTYGGGTITRDGVGLYHSSIFLDDGGVWMFHVKAAGVVIAAAVEDINCLDPFPGVPPPGPSPGQIYDGQVVMVRQGVYTPVAGSLEGDRLQYTPDSTSSTGFSFVPLRNAIIPQIDYTGGVDARPALMALLKRVRQGAWIHLPDGVVKLVYPNTTDHMFADLTAAPGSDRYVGVLPQGVTLTGTPQGFRQPYTIYNNGYTNSGTLVKVYASTGNAAVAHAGELFRGGVNSQVSDLMIDYADQTHNPTSMVVGAVGSFTPYGCTLHAVANYHGVTFQNIICHNAYHFLKWEANGGHVHTLKGFPLLRGVTFPRCGAAPDMTDIQFNGVGDYRDTAAVPAWVKANGTVCVMDGVEGYTIRGFNALGYNIGIMYWDEDGDGFTGVYGTWSGIDFEGINTVILITNAGRTYQPLTNEGGKFEGGTLVPEIGGYGVDFQDTVAPSGPAPFNNRPEIHLIDVTMHSSIAGMSRPIWMRSTSYGRVVWMPGEASQIASELVRNDSANAIVDLDHVNSQTGVRRRAGTGTIYDRSYEVR